MNIVGHKKIINQLDKALAKNNLVQAYLFSGPEQVGKFMVASDFAQKILGFDMSKKISPDFIVVRPEIEVEKGRTRKKDIPVESIRELQHQLSLAPEGKFKVAIIDEAERLTIASQNALLRALEEANSGTVLVLVASDEDKILSTVKSRCHKFKFSVISDRDMISFTKENGQSDGKNLADSIFWSFGRPGLLLEFLGNGRALEDRRKILEEFVDFFSQTLAEKFAWAEKEAKNKEELVKKINIWILILRDSAFGKNRLNLHIDQMKKIKLIDILASGLQSLKETNSNPRLVVENLFLAF